MVYGQLRYCLRIWDIYCVKAGYVYWNHLNNIMSPLLPPTDLFLSCWTTVNLPMCSVVFFHSNSSTLTDYFFIFLWCILTTFYLTIFILFILHHIFFPFFHILITDFAKLFLKYLYFTRYFNNSYQHNFSWLVYFSICTILWFIWHQCNWNCSKNIDT